MHNRQKGHIMTNFKKTCIVTNVQHENNTEILTLMPIYETRHKFTITVPMHDESIFDVQPDLVREVSGYYKGQIINLDENGKITDNVYYNTKSMTYEIVTVTCADVVKKSGETSVNGIPTVSVGPKYGKRITLKGSDLTRRTIWVESDNVHYDTGRFDTVLVRWSNSFDCEIIRNFTLEEKLAKLYQEKPLVRIMQLGHNK